MNTRHAAIISAYTGVSFGAVHFKHFHKYVEEKFGHSVWIHHMADQKFWDKLKDLSREDFMYLAENLDHE